MAAGPALLTDRGQAARSPAPPRVASLRTRIALALCAGFLLSIAVAATAALQYFERNHRNTIARQQVALVSLLAAGTDSRLEYLLGLLARAGRAAAPADLLDAAGARRFLDGRGDLLEFFDAGLAIVDPAGRVIAGSRGSALPGAPAGDTGQATHPALRADAEPRRPRIAGTYRPVREPGDPVLVMTAPLASERGEPAGLLVGELRLRPWRGFAEMAAALIGRTGDVYLVARDRTGIVHADPARAAPSAGGSDPVLDRALDQGFEGSVPAVTAAGTPVLASFKPLRTLDWVVGAHLPMDELDAPFAPVRRAFLAATGVGTALLLFGAWWLLGRLTAPLSTITEHVNRLADDPAAERRLPATRGDEVGQLAGAFNHMLDRLDAREADLRAREAQIRLVTDNVPALIALYDRDRICRFANRHYAQFHGLDPASIVGMHLANVVGAAVAGQLHEHVAAVAGGQARRYDAVRRDGAGRSRSFEISLVPEAAGAGAASGGFYVMMVDVSERRQAEADLRESRERLRSLVELSSDWYWQQDENFRFIAVQEEWAQRNEIRPPSFVGRTRWEVAPDALTPGQWVEHRARLERHEEFRDLEYRREGRDGSIRWVSVSGQPIFDAAGNFRGYRGIGRDVTARREADEALRQSEAKFAGAFLGSPDPITISRLPDDVLVEVNDSFEAVTGYVRAEAIGRPARSLGLWPVTAQREALLHMLAQDRVVRNFEQTLATRDGRRRDCLVNASLFEVRGERYRVTVVRDVTEQRQIELALRESEARFSAMFNESPVALALIGARDSRYLDANAAFLRLFGFAREQVIGNTSIGIGLYADPTDRQDLMAALRQTGSVTGYGVTFRRRDGERRHCEVSARQFRLGDDDVLLWAITDVTGQREAQLALRNTVTRLQTVIMGAPIVLFAFDHEGRFTLSEGRGLEAMGLQPGEVVGSLVAQVYRDAPDVLAELKHALAGETRSSSIRIGAQTFAVYYRPLDPHSTEYRGSIGVLVDVTEQARAEEALRRLNEELEQRVRLRTAELARAGEELVQSEKLAALGRLVAGIAHELNTPIGNSLLVATALSESALELQQALAGGLRRSQLDAFLASTTESGLLLERSLQRAADLIASFKQVAVDQTSAQRRTFDLAEIVRENVMTLGPSLKRLPVTLVDDVPDGIRMDSYPGPLGQVLANLVTNAVLHAFEGRAHGVVRIEARPAGDGAVALTVTDDGCGIPPENLRRVFDPFFTTRMGKGGSGLGLNIVHTLVTGVLGGRIEVRSEPGSGTRFDITLPCFAPAAAMEPAA